MATNRARILSFALTALLLAVGAHGSHITVSVTKTTVSDGSASGVLRVVFGDETPVVDVVVSVYALEGHPSSRRGLRELQALDSAAWWQGLTWTLTDAEGNERAIDLGTVEAIRASAAPKAHDGRTEHRGTFRLPGLRPGDYTIEVSYAGVHGKDHFAVRLGTETPALRDKYLERRAAEAASWAEYRRIQLERLEIVPQRADILLALGRRSLEVGTLDEANVFYDRAIRVMEQNEAEYSKGAPVAKRTETRERLESTVKSIRALQKELPAYFERRADVAVLEEVVEGELRFVLKDRRSGRTTRVIQPDR